MYPPEAHPKARNCWKDSDSIVGCYMLASMSNVLQMQHENFHTAKEIMTNLKDLLGGQVALARQLAITNLMNSQYNPDTPIKEHIIKLTGFFAEAEDNGYKLDVNTQIEIEFKFLTNEFVGFRATYNLGNKALTLTQLMKELQSYELMLNDGKLVQEKPKRNLVVGPSSSKGKQKAKEKKKPTKYSVPPRVDRKKAKK
ncbi:uncharacterized protein LOC105797374 [Gossypium raimondii]|uniref:uncharacterized protein LOC105797374 n=1 Tax=Gossypium raimondii TaxID=29730 RepID=UPI00063AB426|nr:uncharacterized protein LOC105797374 [Gossypium raimondii]